MALYIHPDNQNLLWNILHKNQAFANLDPQYKTQLFKTNIEQIYREIGGKHLPSAELAEYNKRTLRNIVLPPPPSGARMQPHASDRVQMQPPVPASSRMQMQPPALAQTREPEYGAANTHSTISAASFSTQESRNMLKERQSNEQFAKYQEDYNTMFVKKEPKPLEFAEKEDTKIHNMHELIEKHKREREQELQLHAETMKNTMVIQSAPTPTQAPTPTPTQNTFLQEQINELKAQVLFLQNEIKVLQNGTSFASLKTPTPWAVMSEEGQTEPIQNINIEIDENP